MGEEIIGAMELTEEEFGKLSETATRVDYEKVWEKVNGKILTNKRFQEIIGQVRQEAGLKARPLYYSEEKRLFSSWQTKGRKVEAKMGYVGFKRYKALKFYEVPKAAE